MPSQRRPVISPMLIVADPAQAADWYKQVLAAKELFRFGNHLVALDIDGAPVLLREHTPPTDVTPDQVGGTTVCIELFTANPEEVVGRARAAGAAKVGDVTDHQRPWGNHRQGGFTDPWGHLWLVGDYSPIDVSAQ